VTVGTVLLTAGWLAAADETRAFKVPQAKAFRQDLEARVPAGAVVLAERPMRDVIDLTTHAYGVRIEEIVREEVGLTLPAALEYFENNASGLFFLDSSDRARKKGYDQMPVTREKILSRYNLRPLTEFEAGRYGLEAELGAPRVTLYRVEPWRDGESVGSLDVGVGGPGLLRLDGRGIASAGASVQADIFFGDRRVGGALKGGLNWFFVDALPSSAPVPVRVVSGRHLPRDLAPSWYGADKRVDLDVGPDAVPLDSGFLSREFLDVRDRSGERVLEREGEALVPALPIAGTQLIVAARVGPESMVPALQVGFSGAGFSAEFPLEHAAVLRTVSFPIPGPDPGEQTATIHILPMSWTDGEPRAGPLGLLVDRLTVWRLRFTDPPLRVTFGAGAEPYIVDGLYDPETGPGQEPVRWTNGRARLRLPLSAASTDVPWRLDLRLYGPPSVVLAPQLRIALNGRTVAEIPIKSEVAQTLSCVVPRDLLHPGLNELQIDSVPWRPADLLGARDGRALGIMIVALEMVPAKGTP
jgi:hypothetical protein